MVKQANRTIIYGLKYDKVNTMSKIIIILFLYYI